MHNRSLIILFTILLLGLVIGTFLGGRYLTEGMSNGYVTLNTGVSNTPSSSSSSSSSSSTNSGNTGGSYDNYNHYDNSAPSTFYGPNGGIAAVTSVNGAYLISVTDSTGTTTVYSVSGSGSTNSWPSNSAGAGAGAASNTNTGSSIMSSVANTMFYGPNGGSARVFVSANGQYALEVTQPNGTTTIYTATNTYTYTYNQGTDVSGNNAAAPYASSSSTSSYSNGNNYNSYGYDGDNDAGSGAGAGSNSTGSNSTGAYNSTMPQGIPRAMIPQGQEDLYILKSEIVPPVCPACPTVICPPNKKEKCPACPPCGRCPEPAYDCKLVPNYSASNPNLPNPVLSGYSTFGM